MDEKSSKIIRLDDFQICSDYMISSPEWIQKCYTPHVGEGGGYPQVLKACVKMLFS